MTPEQNGKRKAKLLALGREIVLIEDQIALMRAKFNRLVQESVTDAVKKEFTAAEAVTRKVGKHRAGEQVPPPDGACANEENHEGSEAPHLEEPAPGSTVVDRQRER